ncbi:DUF3592 domain-containing protein [Nonomuraea sp. NPDC048881]|uniref:DUF3592 domain-containing protein n=1 Tax=unclassified Nonomuraea TaxID=2593643 RepID=UPI0033E44510
MTTGILLAVAITAGTTLITAAVGVPFLIMARNGQRLLATGIPAQAVVESMADTHMSVNDQPVVSFGLVVQPHEGPAYRVAHRQTLPRIPMGLVVPGAVLPVKVDPARPDRVRIDWAAWRPSPADAPWRPATH